MRRGRDRDFWRGAGVLFLACAILIAAGSPARAQNQSDPKRAQELYEKALQTHNPAARLQFLQHAAQAIAGEPSAEIQPASRRAAANIYYAIGREFYQQARWHLAIVHIEKALALDSTLAARNGGNQALSRFLAQAHHALAQQQLSQGKTGAALNSVLTATRRDSTFLPAYTTLGLIYFQQGKYDAAIAAYNNVLRTQPTAQLYNNLGAAYETKGDLIAAVQAYRHALELDAQLNQAQKNLRRAQEKLASRALVTEKVATAAVLLDSARLITNQRDSTTVATRPAPISSKPKSDKLKKAETSLGKSEVLLAQNAQRANPKGSEKSATPAGVTKPQKTLSSQTPHPPAKSALDENAAKTTTALRTSSSTPFAGNQDTTTVAMTRRPHPLAKSAFDSATTPVSTPSSLRPSLAGSATRRSSVTPLLWVGAGLAILIVFAFMRRHRLVRTWSYFKPALMASTRSITRHERLLPARASREVAATEAHAADEQITGSETSKGAEQEQTERESSPVTANGIAEPRQPSLQTQAFFAEMIAAEPEIEEFAEEFSEKLAPEMAFGSEVKPANGHADAAIVPPLPPQPKEEVETPTYLPASLVVPIVEKNRNNGFEETPPVPAAVSYGSSTPALKTGTTGQKLILNETSSQPPAINTQHQVLGRYVIEREIGKGAMGNIYLAWDPKLDRRVVIKTVCFNLAGSEVDTSSLKDRVYREARAIAKLGHPNIVVVYDVEDDTDLSYIIMEHIEGRDLRQVLASERRFDYPRALKIVAQVCSALDCAHQAGIIHRDVKPSNIMLLSGDKVKVTDFGIAKIADSFALTLPGHVLGTPSYMAPEQFEGEKIDGRADIFSLGVVLYELITGRRPFTGNTLASLAYKIVHKMHIPPSLQNVELPMELDEIIGRALAKQPEERYQTALEFREALLGVEVEMVS